MSKPIHQEVVLKASPKRIYDALMNAKDHAAFTGAPAEISKEVGGAFTLHGGMVTGVNVELVPGKRIVQAWRLGPWPEGVYSIVKFELAGESGQTKLTLDHVGVPEPAREPVESGWTERYWEPLKKFLK